MANPQKENGYTAIANEIMEALAKIRIPGEANQVLFFILRKTYGFQKTQDAISLSQFTNGIGFKKQTVIKALVKLKQMNLVTQKGYGVANIYKFNKDYSTWKPLPKKVIITQLGYSVTQLGNKRNPIGDIQKKVLKETITKENIAAKPLDDIGQVFDLFYKHLNPGINWGNKTERAAADWLIKKYGLEKTLATIQYVISIKDEKFAPTIMTPFQLKSKLGNLLKFNNSQKGEKKGIEI